jgi:hypothetical protein
MQTESPSSGRTVNAVWQNLAPFVYLGLALVIALIVALHETGHGGSVLPSLIYGACVGVLGTWFLVRSVYLVVIWTTRGAPFRQGDRVEVTDGPHSGAVGEVRENDGERNVATVALQAGSQETIVKVFSWEEVRKIPR